MKYFPGDIETQPVLGNIHLLVEYRNNSIHFYNQEGFDVIIFGLAQTSIVNYRDLMEAVFSVDISTDINVALLPLSFGVQPDPVAFLQDSKANPPRSRAVADFLNKASQITEELVKMQIDTARFLTSYKVTLQSVKKVNSADLVVGVVGHEGEAGQQIIERRIDPNLSHPLKQKEILKEVGELHGRTFTSHTFQAIAHKYNLKSNDRLCWIANDKSITRYSRDLVSFLRKLTPSDVQAAVDEYRRHGKMKRMARRRRFTT